MSLERMGRIMLLAIGQDARIHTDRIFFTSIAIVAALTVFMGFAPTYFFRAAPLVPLTPIYHLHAFLFTAWFLLFVVQTALVAGHRTNIHRRLGYAGAVLAVAMVVIGLLVAIDTSRDGFGQTLLRERGVITVDPRVSFSTPVGDILTFTVLAAAGVAARRRADTHKRLMLLATITLVTAAILRFRLGRVGTFVGTDIFVIAIIIYDFTSRGRVHPASMWGGLLVAAFKPWLFYVGSGTAVWLAFTDLLL